MEQLSGRVAVVTGAASGIGLAMAERFAAEGMKVNTSIMRSSRNRPADLAEEGKRGELAQAFGAGLAGRLEGGYPPSEVADQVVRGIRDGRFYVVPAQPEVKRWASVRAQDVIEWRNPTIR